MKSGSTMHSQSLPSYSCEDIEYLKNVGILLPMPTARAVYQSELTLTLVVAVQAQVDERVPPRVCENSRT